MYYTVKDQGVYYVYDENDNLVNMSSTEEGLKEFNPELDTDDIVESLTKPKVPKKKYVQEDKDAALRSYYRNLTGRKEDDVLTEEMLDKETWALRKTSALKNMSVNTIKEKLLK